IRTGLERRSKVRAEHEKIGLDRMEECCKPRVIRGGGSHADRGIEFIDIAIRCNSGGIFRYPAAAEQSGRSVVPGLRINFCGHLFAMVIDHSTAIDSCTSCLTASILVRMAPISASRIDFETGFW